MNIDTQETNRNIDQVMNESWEPYYECVKMDFAELKEHYPFSTMINPPTQRANVLYIQTVAANKELIEKLCATESDFTNAFSRKLLVVVPANYRSIGCDVYGAGWVDMERLREEDRHFNHPRILTKDGYRMCVGIPESFGNLKNIILENVKTAENMLIAYERFQTGVTDHLGLIAYSHGAKGIEEYRRNKAKYTSR